MIIDQNIEDARRVRFVLSIAERALNLPPGADTAMLLQSAMERPEVVSADAYEIIFKLHTHRNTSNVQP